MSWLRRYVLICGGVLAALLAALALLVVFIDLGLTLHGTIALFLAAGFTMLLAMALMGLLFASDRSGHDQDAHHPPPGDDG